MSLAVERDPFIWPDDPNFKSFPKHLPEDCVEYTLHVLDSTLTPAALRSNLLGIQRASDRLQKEVLKGYVWQRDAFSLSLSEPFGREKEVHTGPAEAEEVEEKRKAIEKPLRVSNHNTTESDTIPLHLHGRTSYSDSQADEWLVVYLLQEISKQFPSIWIRVWDSDGEFLLIEAANTLPKWLNPEVAENRVWLHDGNILVIPLQGGYRAKGGLDREVTLQMSLEYLEQHLQHPSDSAYTLLNDPTLNAEAFTRIRNHPQSIRFNLHTSILAIPRKVAYLIHRQPRWVSPAIEAFYLRDPIALKILQTSIREARQRLVFPPEDFVDVPVKFQRVGFAQLRGQEFATPHAWNRFKWPDPKDDVDDLTVQRRRDAGLKLTCGFEMLLGDPHTQGKQSVREMKLLLDDLDAGEEELPDDAKVEQWRTEEKENTETWLDVNYEDLERTLRGQGREAPKSHDDQAATGVNSSGAFGDKAAEENLQRMVQRFEDFLKDEDGGGVEGVDDDDIDEMDRDDGLDNEEESDGSSDSASNDENNEPDLSDAQLQTMIAEMTAMGLKPPPISSDSDQEIRKALLALSDFRAPDIAATKCAPTYMAPSDSVEHTTAGTTSDTSSARAQDAETASRPLWADPDPDSSDNEVEEIPRPRLSRRTMIDDGDTSSDDDFEGYDRLAPSSDEIAHLQSMIESELRQSGALDFDAGTGSGVGQEDPRYNLAKHLLESYKGQAGMAGPAGNMMGLMGLGMPRDEGEQRNSVGSSAPGGGKCKGKGSGRAR